MRQIRQVWRVKRMFIAGAQDFRAGCKQREGCECECRISRVRFRRSRAIARYLREKASGLTRSGQGGHITLSHDKSRR